MTPEMWTIIGVGIALAAALLPGQRAMRKDLAALTGDVSDLRGEFAEFRERMAREMGDLRAQVAREIGELREQMAREMGELREHMAREMGALRERLTRQEGLFEGFSRRRKDPKTI